MAKRASARGSAPTAVAVFVVGLLAAVQVPLCSEALARPPGIAGRAAVLVDARDGHVLYKRNARVRRPIASATKLMTALVSLERLPLGRRLTAARYDSGPAESKIDLRPGERMAVADLLRALLLESANDAAVTLARGASGSVGAFVRRMNQRARALGLEDTHYANPIGLDQPGNRSTALDLARLARTLLRNDSFATIVDSASARLVTGARPRIVQNRNRLVARVPWVNGVKTGHTIDAGYVLVGAASRRGTQLVSVVLGEPSEARRDADTLALLRWGLGRYEQVRALRSGRPVAKADVADYGDREVELTVRRDVRLTVRRGRRVSTIVAAPAELEGPLARGVRVGTVRVFEGRRLVRLVPLVTAERVPEAGFARKAAPYFLWAFLVGSLAAIVALAARRAKR